MIDLQSIGSRQRQVAAAYLGSVAAVVIAARLGLIPGAGEAFTGQPWTAHPYRVSMAAIVVLLAIWLGVGAARLGATLGRVSVGFACLAGGGVVTGAALGLAPWILYPSDQYAVTFMWLMLGAPTGLLAWAAGAFAWSRHPGDPGLAASAS